MIDFIAGVEGGGDKLKSEMVVLCKVCGKEMDITNMDIDVWGQYENDGIDIIYECKCGQIVTVEIDFLDCDIEKI